MMVVSVGSVLSIHCEIDLLACAVSLVQVFYCYHLVAAKALLLIIIEVAIGHFDVGKHELYQGNPVAAVLRSPPGLPFPLYIL